MAVSVGNIEATLQLRDKFSQQIKMAQTSLRKFGASAEQTGRAMSAAGSAMLPLSAAVAAFGAVSVKAFVDFEKGMLKVKALTGATKPDMEALTKTAKDLGANTAFSAKQAAEGMGFLAMSGFEVNEVIGAMPKVIQLATSANLDLAAAADITTNVMKGYGLTVDELERANNALVTAFTSANTDLTQLGQAFKFAGPVAKAAGIGFEEAGAALALMGNAGIQATMAGTGLRGAITKLLNPSKQAAEVMAQIGLSATDSEGKLLSLSEIVKQLEGGALSAADAMVIFGQRAGPAMLALIGQGSQALDIMTSKLENSFGTAAEIAETQLEGLSGAFILLKSAAEGFAISVGETLAPAVTVVVEKLTGMFRFLQESVIPMFQDLPVPIKGVVVAFGAMVAAAGPVLWVLGQLLTAAGVVANFLGGAFMTKVLAVVGAFIGWPVAIAAAVAGLVALFAQTEAGSSILSDLARIIKFVLGEAFEWISGVVSAALDKLQAFWGWIADSAPFKALADSLGNAAMGVREMADQLDPAGKAAREFAERQQEAANAGDALDAALKQNARGLHSLNEEMIKSNQTVETMSDRSKQLAKTGLANLEKALMAAQKAGGLTKVQLQEMARQAKAFKDKGLELSPVLETLVNNVDLMATASEDAADAIGGEPNGLAPVMDGFAEKVAEMGAAIRGTDGIQALEALKEAWSDFSDEERGLKNFQDRFLSLFADLKENVAADEIPRGMREIADGINNAAIAAIDAKNPVAFLREGFVRLGDDVKALPFEAPVIKLVKLATALENFGVKLEPVGLTWAQQLKGGFLRGIKDLGANLGNVIVGAIQGGGDVGAAIGAQIGSTLGTNLGETVATALGGGMLGSVVGGFLGPLGAMAGQFIGDWIGGLFTGPSNAERVARDAGAHLGLQVTEQFAEQLGKMVDDGKFKNAGAALMGNLAEVFAQNGGVVEIGLEKAIKLTRDLFSNIDQGNLTVEQAGEQFRKIFGELLPAVLADGSASVTDSFAELMDVARDFANRMGLDITEVLEMMNDEFNETFRVLMVRAVEDGFDSVEEEFIKATELAQQFGVDVSDSIDMIQEKLDSVNLERLELLGEVAAEGMEAIGALMESGSAASGRALESTGLAALAFFNQAIASGMTFGEALAQFAPQLTQITDAYRKAGIQIPKEFRLILQAAKLVTGEISGPLIENANNAAIVLNSLGTIGGLNNRQFRMWGKTIQNNFKALVEGGASSEAAIMAMRGPISTLIRLQDEYGFKVDAATQDIIDQGRAAGITGEESKTAAEKQLEAFDKIIDALNTMIELLGGVKDEVDKIPTEVNTTVKVSYDDPGFDGSQTIRVSGVPGQEAEQVINVPGASGSFTGGPVRGFSTGTNGAFASFDPRGEAAILHGDEAIVPRGGGADLAGEIAEALGPLIGGGGVTVAPGAVSISLLDGRDVDEELRQTITDVVTEALQDQDRTGVRLVQAAKKAVA